jgi:hypothetical protein
VLKGTISPEYICLKMVLYGMFLWMGHKTLDFSMKKLSIGPLKLTSSTFLRKMASIDTTCIPISTYRVPMLLDQSDSVFHLFLVPYWLNVFLFPVSCGGGRSSSCKRKTAQVTLTVLENLQDKTATIGMTKLLHRLVSYYI